MSKAKTQYVCDACGAATPRWAGKCPSCEEWNTLIEKPVESRSPSATGRSPLGRGGAFQAGGVGYNRPRPIGEVSRSATERLQTGFDEFDRILGGGLVPGAITLIGGEPGIGKSTLLLQALAALSQPGRRTLYATGEEAAEQVRLRAERLDALRDDMYIVAENSLEAILSAIDEVQPNVVVVDSIQAVATEALSSGMGSIAQARECATQLTRLGKARHLPIFLVGHVTKSGAVAGPRVLEHMVDTVLYFEGGRNWGYRVLRAVKNRFGSVDEIGIFEMRETGLIPVQNPSAVFLEERPQDTPGSVVTAAMEGSRPLMIEVQALLSDSGGFGAPRRSVSGLDQKRVALLVAVLEKRLGLRMTQLDAFVNIPGGLRVEEPAADLAALVAMVSSFRNQPVDPGWVFIGEVGLAGEIRSVNQVERRLAEAQRNGFTQCLLGGRRRDIRRAGMRLVHANDAQEALKQLGLF